MEKLKRLYLKSPWIILAAITVIVLGAAVKIFLKPGVLLTVIIGIIVFLSFIVLAYCMMVKQSTSTGKKEENMSIGKLKSKVRASRLTEDMMTVVYMAIIVFGAFVDSVMMIVAGIVVFVIHITLSYWAERHYIKEEKKRMNQYEESRKQLR